MIGNRPAIVWLRDWRMTFIVLIWAMVATLFSIRLSLQSNLAAGSVASSVPASKTGSMFQLVAEKSTTGAQNGLGYLYEAGQKCPYTWHGGAPDSDVRGSCWCGLDSYCMCTPSLAIDAIIEVPGNVAKPGESEQEPYIVVVRRRDPPKDTHAIPGGFVDVGESVEAATIREVKEETNLNVARLEQFHVYSEPSRDKRRHTVSVVFRCIIDDISSLHKGDDAKGVDLIKLTDLFKPDVNLAFDHAEIFKQYARKMHPELAGVPE